MKDFVQAHYAMLVDAFWIQNVVQILSEKKKKKPWKWTIQKFMKAHQKSYSPAKLGQIQSGQYHCYFQSRNSLRNWAILTGPRTPNT